MVNSHLISALMGTLLGFLSGLGIGGGSLLMLWLTLVAGFDHGTARAVNMMFFVAAAGSVCILRWKNRTLSIKPVLPAAIAGCIAAGLFSWVGQFVNGEILQKIFGGLLLFIGIKELFYRERNAK